MTSRLRDSLRTAASDVPAYPVYEKALATARRSRRRTALAAMAALVLTALAGALLPATGSSVPAAGTDAALPDRVGVPPRGSLHATDRPRIGPSSVIFTGRADGMEWANEHSIIAIVGADSDRYRIIKGEADTRAGANTVLSPDGRQIAFSELDSTGPRVRIVDLATGDSRTVDSGIPNTVQVVPVAWSPDGRTLVLRDTLPPNDDALSIVTLDGERIRLAEAGEPGSPVAFSPDGARLAFQSGRNVSVVDLAGRRLSSFTLPPETELAGKGAWSADGRTLTMTRHEGMRWSLRRVDPTTGRDLGALDVPAVSGVTAIRLLGWSADGSARVVAYQPAATAEVRFDIFLEMEQRLAYANVSTVQVLALGRGAGTPTTLLTAPQGVIAIDVADNVIRGGQVRHANPPTAFGPRFWLWTGLITVLLVGIVLYRTREKLALWLDDQRVSRRQAAD
ncbi:hypothetical protein Ais01nite_33300 [Asanoa ishikariensis]|uniref:WD40-like Beta Propeller Repeat n=1 Tax=Asanoa ishikariensis TaxID=137265 RepID=A0A1H3L6H9_9ACTN|nr:PD40 domain-containing protein [Asanoa ishikariensis]GIF65295.1 hypothetical protein Ais01nite_33300 [Asanoa ishikariensis]SDY60127.1 WD40-like Beta Propeller Repeat [Asanoa ishikariensis]